MGKTLQTEKENALRTLKAADREERDFVVIGQRNLDIVNDAIRKDPSYARQFFEDATEADAIAAGCYARDYIRSHWTEENLKNLEKRLEIVFNIAIRIDYENATHLSSGIGAAAISKKIVDRLGEGIYQKAGDPTSGLKDVDHLIQDEYPLRKDSEEMDDYYAASFVSKFFTYVNRFGYGRESRPDKQYSIFDSVMAVSLPYYLDKYCPEDLPVFMGNLKITKVKGGMVESVRVRSYSEYYESIGKLLAAINGKGGVHEITREELDRILWYYYRKTEKDKTRYSLVSGFTLKLKGTLKEAKKSALSIRKTDFVVQKPKKVASVVNVNKKRQKKNPMNQKETLSLSEKILEILNQKGPSTRKELGAALGREPTSFNPQVVKLIEAGKIRVVEDSSPELLRPYHDMICLNKPFEGGWQDKEGNSAHEIVDFLLTDEGEQYVYALPWGQAKKEAWTEGPNKLEKTEDENYWTKYMVLTDGGSETEFDILFVIKLEEKLHRLLRPAKEIRQLRENQDTLKHLMRERKITYNGKYLDEIYPPKDASLYLTYKAKGIYQPKGKMHVALKGKNYTHNKGYLKSDEYPDDFKTMETLIGGLEKNDRFSKLELPRACDLAKAGSDVQREFLVRLGYGDDRNALTALRALLDGSGR